MNNRSRPGLREALLVGLSLSIGWGIRGNFGHEYGAMIPGALAGMAVALLSGRSDWQRRIVFFAFFGALGWSFGGSMSYGHVIGYTHSGHSISVLYGFACLFVIGFLWAALGGAGTALPAVLTRERLTALFAPIGAVFLAWLLQDIVVSAFFNVDSDLRQESPLYWYDADWLAALGAIAAVLALAAARRGFDDATSLALHLVVGWWIGFLVLVNLLGLRMTPPRGDNWAGCVGMVVGLFVYCRRHGLAGVANASLVSGFVGGFGFASAQALKLLGIATDWHTNWHSVLEQSYGFINGIGIALALFWLARLTPKHIDEPPTRRWTEPCAVGFVMLGITYLNLSKNPDAWTTAKSVPDLLYGIRTATWFDIAYLTIGLGFIGLLIAHGRRPLDVVPAQWIGRGQLLYAIFLWWVVVGNFERALVAFAPVRLVTEGVIHLNAVVCTVGVLVCARVTEQRTITSPVAWARVIRLTTLVGLAAMIVSVLGEWGVTRAVYGKGEAMPEKQQIRFGPNATATKARPRTGQPHP